MLSSLRRSMNKLISVTLMFVLLFSFTTQVFAATKTLSVTRVTQSKDKWCWAACSEMIGTYKNSNSTRDQWDVVAYVKDSSYPNKTATSSEIEKGIKYASVDKVTYQTSSSPLSFSTTQSNIDSSNPIVVWMTWNNGEGHVVVCSGYQTSGKDEYLYLLDPASGASSNYYDYTTMKNGITIQSGTGKYTKTIYKK